MSTRITSGFCSWFKRSASEPVEATPTTSSPPRCNRRRAVARNSISSSTIRARRAISPLSMPVPPAYDIAGNQNPDASEFQVAALADLVVSGLMLWRSPDRARRQFRGSKPQFTVNEEGIVRRTILGKSGLEVSRIAFGTWELVLAAALAELPREKVVIAPKGGLRPEGSGIVGDASASWTRRGVDASLRAL